MMTYAVLTGIPLLLAIWFDLWIGKKFLLNKNFWILAFIFLGAMLVFDTYLTALPIVLYNREMISGIFIGTIPIEDFFYGFTLILTVLSLPTILLISKKEWKTLFLSSRPFSWINTAYPAALSIFLARNSFDWADFWCIFYFLIPYNLLVYGVNDVYDYETDRKNPRKQSIEGAILPKNLHKIMLWISIGLSLVFLPVFMKSGELIFLYVLALVFALGYSIPPVRTKTKPFFDSITSSLHFVLPAVIGYTWGGGEEGLRGEFVSFFCWGLASHMLGALPDIIPDKKAGMRTVATMLGETKTAVLIFFFYALSAGILLIHGNNYFILGSALSLYTLFPIFSLLDPTIIPTLFRKFMYYNLVVGFVITIIVILHFLVK